jgi:inosose dehydratase
MENQKIKIANAPCSWGALEFDLDGKAAGFEVVLNEMVETGYAGTELGDWGFMPTDPDLLKKELSERKLELLGAFVPVALDKKASHQEGIQKALKVAGLMHSAGYQKAFIVLADDNGSVPERTQNAGRITTSMGMNDEQWRNFAAGSDSVALAVREKYGMRTVFHHHCAGYIETAAELDHLMELTNPELLGLCLDMGHLAFGGGDPVATLKKHYHRIWHVHFKDYDPQVGQQSRINHWDYFESVRHGVFCELGKGNVDFKEITKELIQRNYHDWIVVEQDVLPGMGSPKVCALKNRNYIKSLGM